MSNRGSKICLCDLWINHRGERRGRWYQMRTVREGMIDDFINMTQGQLFIKYWWLYLILSLIGGIVAGWMRND
jgi:hypothetical protein